MPDFDPPVFPAPGCDGSLLRPDPAAILEACAPVGPLFVLFRNDACILGSVANPLRMLEPTRLGVASGGAITLNLASKRRCSAFSYVETGPHGGIIDAIEFCGSGRAGFLKVCRMDATCREEWRRLLAGFHEGIAPAASIAGIRKTNHLETPVLHRSGCPSPAELVMERFLECVIQAHAALHVVAQSPCGRGRLDIRPTHRVRAGHWTVLSSNTDALHIACGAVGELRVAARPHVLQLVLMGGDGRFLARISTRDRGVVERLSEIL